MKNEIDIEKTRYSTQNRVQKKAFLPFLLIKQGCQGTPQCVKIVKQIRLVKQMDFCGIRNPRETSEPRKTSETSDPSNTKDHRDDTVTVVQEVFQSECYDNVYLISNGRYMELKGFPFIVLETWERIQI